MPWRKRGGERRGRKWDFSRVGLARWISQGGKGELLLTSIDRERGGGGGFFFFETVFFCGLQHCVIEISLSAISMRASCSHRRQTSAELGEKDLASQVNRKGWDQNPSSGLTSHSCRTIADNNKKANSSNNKGRGTFGSVIHERIYRIGINPRYLTYLGRSSGG